jgi:Na+-translocating ferredoxin:NAD+ oxidoreductase RnfD subunit
VTLRLRGRSVPVVLPSWRDIRFRLTAVIIVLQVLGQTVLRFKVSVAQIIVTMLVCGVIELVFTYRREKRLVWPASALQTGASVAFILRASGTVHGDIWSLRGIHLFVIAGVVSLLSKYLVRPGSKKHIFNPSNIGIVAVLLVVGPDFVFSEHLWWGPLGIRVLSAVAVILVGGLWILRPVKMVAMVTSFLVTLGSLVAVFAVMGRSFYATWRPDPVTGSSYWLNIALSPEVWAYAFFMMSDPQTAPKSRQGRMIYGAVTGALTAALLYFQTTEFGIKVALLGSLTVACALTPSIERICRRLEARHQRPDERAAAAATAPVTVGARTRPRRLLTALRTPAVVAAAIIAVGTLVDTAALPADKGIVLIERDLPAPGSVQSGVLVHNPHRQ